jgi:6-pyruvoyl-tetrahydropterin synthase
MQYNRTYHFQAAHFNSRQAYETAWAVVDFIDAQKNSKAEKLGEFPQGITIYSVLQALTNVHGHNFKIVVDLRGEVESEGWLCDDVRLEKIVMRYAGKNISLHPDFLISRDRATTELIADKMRRHIIDEFPFMTHVGVTVYETDDIFAVVE